MMMARGSLFLTATTRSEPPCPPLRQLRSQQQLVRSPNTQDRGYVRQKANNKLWIRERLDALLDQNSFTEVGSITGQPVFDERPESWSLSFLRMHTIFFFYV
jgi:hypothetical protein